MPQEIKELKCKICQFENGKHSFECPKYKEQKNPMKKEIKEKQKYYKCKDCKTIRTIITLGDLTIGCADCGGRGGFLEKSGKNGKWQERGVSAGEDKLSRYLISGKL